jgi:hypothetical protein
MLESNFPAFSKLNILRGGSYKPAPSLLSTTDERDVLRSHLHLRALVGIAVKAEVSRVGKKSLSYAMGFWRG